RKRVGYQQLASLHNLHRGIQLEGIRTSEVVVSDQRYIEAAFLRFIVSMRRFILVGTRSISEIPQAAACPETLVVGIQFPSRHINDPGLQVELRAWLVIHLYDRVLGNRDLFPGDI